MSVTVRRTCAMELVLIVMGPCCQPWPRDDLPAPPRSVLASIPRSQRVSGRRPAVLAHAVRRLPPRADVGRPRDAAPWTATRCRAPTGCRLTHARIAVVRIGMTMPVMEPNLDAATLKAWARVIDGGPFASLCWGERIAFDNPECLTLLGALSAWTDRVRLMTTVVVPQLHDPVMLAKQLATGDMLSGGRLTVGIGAGGRLEDYHAVGADPARQSMRGLADGVAVMQRIWAGEKVTESVVPVGPSPLQAGGPELLIGTMGPKTARRAAAGADGRAGTTLDLDVAKQNELFDVARQSWAQAGKAKPYLATS